MEKCTVILLMFRIHMFSNLKSMIATQIFSKKQKNKQKKRKQELCKLRKGSRGKTINEMKTSTRVDNFNFVGLAGGEAARGEEAGTDKKKGENGGVLVHDRQCPSRG